jgi:DNA end-binding protein Ku
MDMAKRSIGSGTITFGLVSIPVKLYVATHSEQLSFNLLHAACGTRVRQQFYCPHHKRVVERGELVKGLPVSKNRYVRFTGKDLDALEAEANRAIDIQEFVPLESVDPIYFEDSHYLGPEDGAEKPYRLLAEAMRDASKGGLAQFTHHGKEHLVLIRALDAGLVLHSMYYADEVRSMREAVGTAGPRPRSNELAMAERLIEQLSTKAFDPERYEDRYRERLKKAVARKRKGEEITAAEPEEKPGKVIDLMDALKASLEKRGGTGRRRSAARAARSRRPAAARKKRASRRARG